MLDVRTIVIVLLPAFLAIGCAFVPRRTTTTPIRVVGVWLVLVVVAVTGIGDHVGQAWPSHQEAVNRVQAILILLVGAAFAWLNRRGRTAVRAAVLGVVLGAAANALPTLAYGGMPVWRAAGIEAGYTADQMSGPHPTNGYVLSDGRGWFAHFFGDFIPVPSGRVVFSIGDVLLWAGLAVLLGLTLRSVAPVRRAASTDS